METLASSKYTRVKVIIGVTVLAVAAGYVGGLSGQNYIDYIRQFIQPEQLIQRPTSNRSFSLADLIAHTSPSIVAIYRLDDKTSKDAVYPLPTQQSYVGDAVAVSSDGWLVTPTVAPIVGSDKKEPVSSAKYFGIYKQEVYPVKENIIDTVAGVSFLKIEGVRLKSASFAWEQSTVGSISVRTVSSKGEVEALYLSQPQYFAVMVAEAYLLHTNVLDKRFNPDTTFASVGVAVVADNGDILGITDKKGIIPAYRFRASLDQLLSDHKIQRISSNATYYDNAWMPHIQFTPTAFSSSGATIVDPGNLTVPDASLGLKKGDVVLHVNNENIDINRSLSDVLNQYKPGDVVTVGIQRNGANIDVSLTLK